MCFCFCFNIPQDHSRVEKEIKMDVIKGYVEVNDDVENETMRYM